MRNDTTGFRLYGLEKIKLVEVRKHVQSQIITRK